VFFCVRDTAATGGLSSYCYFVFFRVGLFDFLLLTLIVGTSASDWLERPVSVMACNVYNPITCSFTLVRCKCQHIDVHCRRCVGKTRTF